MINYWDLLKGKHSSRLRSQNVLGQNDFSYNKKAINCSLSPEIPLTYLLTKWHRFTCPPVNLTPLDNPLFIILPRTEPGARETVSLRDRQISVKTQFPNLPICPWPAHISLTFSPVRRQLWTIWLTLGQGSWHAAAHGVAKNQTQLSNWKTTTAK